MHQRRRSGLVDSMMRGQVQIHRPDGIVRTHQSLFRVPGVIAQIDRAELAVRDDRAHRVAIVGVDARFVARLKGRTFRVGLARAGSARYRSLQHLGRRR